MHFWFDAVGHSLGSSFEPVSLPYERNGRFIAGISSARVSQTGRSATFKSERERFDRRRVAVRP